MSLLSRLSRKSPEPPPAAAPEAAAESKTLVNQAPPITHGLYVHVHNTGEPVDVPGLPGVRGVRVTGKNDNPDTHLAPGGRNQSADFRLGMRAGGTYTASVSVFLAEPLTGLLNPLALRIVPGCIDKKATIWTLASSVPARNEYGHHRISLTFTVPETATAAWVRLIAGMTAGRGEIYWHTFTLTESDTPADPFDGATPADDFYTYAWTGTPGHSASVRTRRAYPEIAAAADRQRIADEAVRRGDDGLLAELGAAAADPIWRIATARRQKATGDAAAARATLRKLIKDGDEHGDAAYELGVLTEESKSWAAAEKLYRQALAGRPDSAERHYRVAGMLDKLGRRDDSRQMSLDGLKHDVELPFDGVKLLHTDVKLFRVRRAVALFLHENLDQLRTQVEQRRDNPVPSTMDQPLFVYWAQGFDAAPPLVRRCVAELRAQNPATDLHELTDATMPYYADLPQDLLDVTENDKTHRADLVRLTLLEKFGGVWIDSTVYAPAPLRPTMTAILDEGPFFAFRYQGPNISNWFLAAKPGSYIAHMWRAAMYLWWEKNGYLIDYFLSHHTFEMLYYLDAEFAAEWDSCADRSSRPPHAFQFAMFEPYEAERWQGFLDNSFVHKLKYKYQPAQVRPGSFVAHFMRRDFPA